MVQLFKLAFRNLGRNRRRSFFSALALGMGLAILLLMAAVLDGEMRQAMEGTIRLQSGHLQVQASNYNEDRTSLAWEDLIEKPEEMASKIASLEPVAAATPRLFASGIAASGDKSQGVRVIGIDPASEANAPYVKGLVSGEFLAPDDRDGILIGLPLAEKFSLKVGDRFNLLINTSGGSVDEQSFIIRGIYSTRTSTYDKSTVFLSLAKAQAITQTENHASIIFILLKDRSQTEAVANALQAGSLQVKTWMQMNELVLQTEQFADAYMVVLFLIVLAITATVIVNTLVMAVFERTREIGILSAIGTRSSRIMAMFFAESVLLGIGGIVIGLILGGVMVALAANIGFYIGDMGVSGMLLGDRIYAHLTLGDTVTLTITTLVVALLAALYPALLAARMEPVQALHGGK